MRKLFATNQEKDQLNDFKLGQIDILSWLEVTFEKEISQIENQRAQEILNINTEEYACLVARYKMLKLYLFNVKETKKRIKGE